MPASRYCIAAMAAALTVSPAAGDESKTPQPGDTTRKDVAAVYSGTYYEKQDTEFRGGCVRCVEEADRKCPDMMSGEWWTLSVDKEGKVAVGSLPILKIVGISGSYEEGEAITKMWRTNYAGCMPCQSCPTGTNCLGPDDDCLDDEFRGVAKPGDGCHYANDDANKCRALPEGSKACVKAPVYSYPVRDYKQRLPQQFVLDKRYRKNPISGRMEPIYTWVPTGDPNADCGTPTHIAVVAGNYDLEYRPVDFGTVHYEGVLKIECLCDRLRKPWPPIGGPPVGPRKPENPGPNF